MSREDLRALVECMFQRTEGELWTLILAQLDADAAALTAAKVKSASLQAKIDRDWDAIEWERKRAQSTCDTLRESHARWEAKAQAEMDYLHRLGEQVRLAHVAGRKVIRIGDIMRAART